MGMSPIPSPASRRGRDASPALLLALATLGSAAVAAPASAAEPPPIPVVEQPIPSDGGLTSVGEKVIAWTVDRDDSSKHPLMDIWMLKDGVPVRAGTVPDTIPKAVADDDEALREGSLDLEVGTAAGGVPVAVVRTPGIGKNHRRGLDRTSLVRLDTGAVRRLPTRIDGLQVNGTAVDHGKLYFTVARDKPTSKSTSALWRASVTPTRTGKPTKIRTSRRGSIWYSILADRGRVAINATEPSKESYYDDVYAFGTPRGTWNRAALIGVSDGPIPSHSVAGFTKDGSALVTILTQGDDQLASLVSRTPIDQKKPETSVTIGTSADLTTGYGAFDPETGRLLTSGPGPDGKDAFGFSGVAFAP